MWKIAICDDEELFCNETKRYLQQIGRKIGEEFIVDLFGNAEKLLSEMPSDLDILLLDIKMSEMTGIEAAREIRKTNDTLCIIFITSMTEYAMEGYEVHAFGFIKKPVCYAPLERNITEAIKRLASEKNDSAPLGIDYSILIDAKVFERMSDIDICTFFGNALDNAVEACEKVDDESNRFITIKSGIMADRALVEITNSCKIKPMFKNGIPVSLKSDKDKHGIGVTSIKRIAEKYDGMIKIDTSSADAYKLVRMFPFKAA